MTQAPPGWPPLPAIFGVTIDNRALCGLGKRRPPPRLVAEVDAPSRRGFCDCEVTAEMPVGDVRQFDHRVIVVHSVVPFASVIAGGGNYFRP
jgi:hypothetical protein